MTTPLLSSVVLAGSAIELAGSEDQRSTWLPGICDGSTIGAFAYQETGRHSPFQVNTRLEKSGDQYELNGSKQLVLDGGTADLLVVLARINGENGDRDGLCLVALPANTPGISIKNNLLLDSRRVANVHLDQVKVNSDQVLGSPGNAADQLDTIFNRASVALSAEMLGGIQATFDMTLDYLRVREQFGATIGSFQGLKHRAARWFCEVELSKSIVLQALRAIDDDSDQLTELASACKARASDTYRLSGKEGIQMHGGIGVTDEHDVGLYMKHARVTEMLLGDGLFHTARFAEARGY